jgi:Na+-transporting methylmalonyl-CoA/oxaloacetate decarboxylase gamma subunit
MENVLLQGLTLSALGLGLTFAALGVFILLIVGLQRAFAVRPAPPAAAAPEPAPTPGVSARDSEAEEIAAAICIALSHLRALEICESGLGEALEAGRGPWWQPAARQPSVNVRRPA